MHVKNHMPMWILWILWILRVECSSNPLYKPLCAFLVFVDLVWIMCGRLCGFWSCVVGFAVFVSSLRVRSTSCGLCGSVVLPSIPMLASGLARPLARRDCASTWRRSLWIGGLALDADADADADGCPHRCASTCSLWSDKKICPLPYFVLCSVSSPLGATFTNGENDHG